MSGGSKPALREAMLLARLRIAPHDRAAFSLAIAARVVALDAFTRARTVGLYAPMGAEVDTAEIARAAAAAGKRVAYPLVAEGGRALAFAACSAEALVPGPLRTREPPRDAPEVPYREIDLVLVPGVAFDSGCHRLGRGGGYYDATLAALGGAARVGLAFEAQIVPAVPHEPHDASLDAVVTEAALRIRGPAGDSR